MWQIATRVKMARIAVKGKILIKKGNRHGEVERNTDL